MRSMSPVTTMSWLPATSGSLVNIAAFIAEPQTLLIVVAPADFGRPAPIDAWRAGASAIDLESSCAGDSNDRGSHPTLSAPGDREGVGGESPL